MARATFRKLKLGNLETYNKWKGNYLHVIDRGTNVCQLFFRKAGQIDKNANISVIILFLSLLFVSLCWSIVEHNQ